MGVEIVHSCDICQKPILKGEKYTRDEDNLYVHIRCLNLLSKEEKEYWEDMDLMGF